MPWCFPLVWLPIQRAPSKLGVKIGANNEIVVDEGMRTSIPGIFAVGDVVGPPYFMALARKGGMVAAKNIFRDWGKKWITHMCLNMSTIPPLEATYVGLTEEEARKQYKNVVVIKVPVGERPQILSRKSISPVIPGWYCPSVVECTRWISSITGKISRGCWKLSSMADSRRYLGFHHVGDGAKVSFQYLSYLLKQGWTVDQMDRAEWGFP